MSDQGSGMFAGRAAEKRFPTMAVAIASVAVVILVGVLVLVGRNDGRATNAVKPLAAYASSLTITDLKMSESTSVGNVRQMYIDGNILNTGTKTVSGIAVQTLFANDVQMPPQVESQPLTLIRTHEPYVDTEPVSADPLGPGAKREFRLIFEGVGTDWNQAMPEIRVTGVMTK